MVEALVLIVFVLYLIVEIGVGLAMLAAGAWSILLLARYMSPPFPRVGLLVGGALAYPISLLLVGASLYSSPGIFVLPFVAALCLPITPAGELAGGVLGWLVQRARANTISPAPR